VRVRIIERLTIEVESRQREALKALCALLTKHLGRHILGEVATDDAAHLMLALF
jgi:hypothetical protein